jgi:hypothetical protein
MDWNDKKCIANIHKWRKQIIDRRLGAAASAAPKTTRPHWTEREQGSIHSLMKARMEEKGEKLILKDFVGISKEHNENHVGKEIRIGEKTPAGYNSQGKWSKGSIVKERHTLGPRTANAVYAQAIRWPETKGMIKQSQGKANSGVGNDASAGQALLPDELEGDEVDKEDYTQEPLDQESVAGDMDNELYHSSTSDGEDEDEDTVGHQCHGGDFDPHLDESSDDEDEGQRPASNQTGALCVSAY